MAFQFGVPIIPVYAFGVEKSFTFWSIKNETVRALGRKIGFLPIIYFGLWASVYGPSKPCDYTNVIGIPISVPKNDNPTETEMREVLAIYIKATIDLFEKHKADYGMQDVKLRIV